MSDLNFLYQQFKDNGYILNISQLNELGVPNRLIYKYVEDNLLERVARGIYTLPDTVVDETYILSKTSDIIFSHDTAAYFNELVGRTPFRYSITTLRDKSVLSPFKSRCNCFYVKPEYLHLGLITKVNNFGNLIQIYNAERTLCDMLRSRKRLNDELVIDCIKNYALLKNKNLFLLNQFAELFRVEKQIKLYMEVLL